MGYESPDEGIESKILSFRGSSRDLEDAQSQVAAIAGTREVHRSNDGTFRIPGVSQRLRIVWEEDKAKFADAPGLPTITLPMGFSVAVAE